MGTRLSSSPLYAHLWGTPELDAIFDERAMLQTWLDVLAALARAQARWASCPPRPPPRSPTGARVEALDLDYVAEQTRATSHSTLGLIRGLQRVLPADVPASTSTSAPPCRTSPTRGSGCVMRDVGGDRLAGPAGAGGCRCSTLAAAAPRHGDGRPHPRPARRPDHVRVQGRVLGRRGAPAPRPAARGPRRAGASGQLGGAVGALAFFGAGRAAELRARLLRRAGARRPGDLLADRARPGRRVRRACWRWCAGRSARIGTEVYELARPEIGELAEPAPRRRGRQHHDAAQAQPRGQRAPRHAGPARPGRRPAVLVEGMVAGARARRAGVEGGVGGAARGLPAHRRRAAARRSACSRVSRCTRRRWRPTSSGRRRAGLGAGAGRAVRRGRQAPGAAGAARGAARGRRRDLVAGARRARRGRPRRRCAAGPPRPPVAAAAGDGRRGARPAARAGAAPPSATGAMDRGWTRVPLAVSRSACCRRRCTGRTAWRRRSAAGRCWSSATT